MDPLPNKWLFTKEELRQSPSFHAGVQVCHALYAVVNRMGAGLPVVRCDWLKYFQPDVEKAFRLGSIAMMRMLADKLLKCKVGEVLEYRPLARETFYTAVVMFNRYWCAHSVLETCPTRSDVAFGAMLLAMKAEDYMTAMPGVFQLLIRLYQSKILKCAEPIREEVCCWGVWSKPP